MNAGSDATTKRPHALYRSTDAATFAAAFEAETGRRIEQVVAELCVDNDACGVVLGGSLPLGLGTPASDVDLLVLLDDADQEMLPKPNARDGIVFAGRFADSGAQIARAEIVAVVAGIEVNCQLLSATAVERAGQQISRAQVSLTPYEIGLLSRLKTGWTLEHTTAFDRRCAPLVSRNALEIRSAVWYLVGAAQDLEDARSALADSPMLALHLGRSCAERAILAFFAAQGFAYVGAKWMRAFEPAHAPGRLGRIAGALPGGRAALRILFPDCADPAGAVAYLEDVGSFMADIRREIESEAAFKIAIALCPQLRNTA